MSRIIPEKDMDKFIQATGWKPGQEVSVDNDIEPESNMRIRKTRFEEELEAVIQLMGDTRVCCFVEKSEIEKLKGHDQERENYCFVQLSKNTNKDDDFEPQLSASLFDKGQLHRLIIENSKDNKVLTLSIYQGPNSYQCVARINGSLNDVFDEEVVNLVDLARCALQGSSFWEIRMKA